MSRHQVEARLPKEHQCYVGWDRGYESFYFYVMRHLRTEKGKVSTEHDGHVVKCGGLPPDKPVETFDELKEAIRPWAELTDYLRDVLEEDRAKEGGGEPEGSKAVAPRR